MLVFPSSLQRFCPIFKLALFTRMVELWLQMNDLKLVFFDPSRDVAAATNFVGKIDFQSTSNSKFGPLA